MNPLDIKLPTAVATKHQFVRFLAEFESLDGELTNQEIRASTGVEGGPGAAENLSIAQFLQENGIALTDSDGRTHMLEGLRSLRKTAPVVHLTFAGEADPASLAEIADWFRKNMNPHTLIEVGLQPGLVAGTYIRSQNKVYDYSLRSRIIGKRDSLVDALRGNS